MESAEFIAKLEVLSPEAVNLIANYITFLEADERYLKDTTEERKQELVEQYKSRYKQQKEAERRAAAQAFRHRKQARIAALTGKQRRIWDKIECTRNQLFRKYPRWSIDVSVIEMLRDINENNYVEVWGAEYDYGFHQGLKFAAKYGTKAIKTL